MDSQVYKIYAFTDLHVASGDSSVSGPPLSVCGQREQEEERKVFLQNFSQLFLSSPRSFQLRSLTLACVCVCVWLLCAEVAACWRGGAGGVLVLVPARAPGPHPPTHTQPG